MSKRLMKDFTKKFYSIGEVSDLLSVPTSTLRYYEKEFPTVKPVRSSTGRRMYRLQDIETLKIILFLIQNRGMHIEAAREEMRRNRDGVQQRADAIERLRAVRDKLQLTIDALHQFR